MRNRRRVAAIALIVAGLVLMAWPVLIRAYGQVAQAELSGRFASAEAAASAERQGTTAFVASDEVSPDSDDASDHDASASRSDDAAGDRDAIAMPSSIGASGSADVMQDDTSGPFGKLSPPDTAGAWTDTGEPIARIQIPRIGLSAIVVEGADSAALRQGPGHLPDTAPPGGPGNCAIAAHRDRWFERLSEVQTGDPVVLETPDYRFEYAVSAKRVVTPDRGDLLASGADPTLTLITCTGAGYPHSLYRLLIFCRLRSSTPR